MYISKFYKLGLEKCQTPFYNIFLHSFWFFRPIEINYAKKSFYKNIGEYLKLINCLKAKCQSSDIGSGEIKSGGEWAARAGGALGRGEVGREWGEAVARSRRPRWWMAAITSGEGRATLGQHSAGPRRIYREYATITNTRSVQVYLAAEASQVAQARRCPFLLKFIFTSSNFISWEADHLPSVYPGACLPYSIIKPAKCVSDLVHLGFPNLIYQYICQ